VGKRMIKSNSFACSQMPNGHFQKKKKRALLKKKAGKSTKKSGFCFAKGGEAAQTRKEALQSSRQSQAPEKTKKRKRGGGEKKTERRKSGGRDGIRLPTFQEGASPPWLAGGLPAGAEGEPTRRKGTNWNRRVLSLTPLVGPPFTLGGKARTRGPRQSRPADIFGVGGFHERARTGYDRSFAWSF